MNGLIHYYLASQAAWSAPLFIKRHTNLQTQFVFNQGSVPPFKRRQKLHQRIKCNTYKGAANFCELVLVEILSTLKRVCDSERKLFCIVKVPWMVPGLERCYMGTLLLLSLKHRCTTEQFMTPGVFKKEIKILKYHKLTLQDREQETFQSHPCLEVMSLSGSTYFHPGGRLYVWVGERVRG